MAETIAAVIVGLLGLLLNAALTGKKEREQSHETKRNELREALADDEPAAVHGALGEQHDRVREALRGHAGGEQVTISKQELDQLYSDNEALLKALEGCR